MRKTRHSHLAFLLTSILATPFALFGQTATPTPKPTDDDEIIKVDSRLIVVPVSVTDANGQAILGLKAQDFKINEENRPQVIDSVGTAESVPLEIALLFDISATTSPMFKFQQETAAKFLKDVMRENDRATIFTVGSRAQLIQSRATAEKSIESIRSIIPTKEQTAFYDSLNVAAQYLQKNSPQSVRKVIVIISDGEDTNSAGVIKALFEAERKVTDDVRGEKLRELRVKARDSAKVAEQNKVLRSLQNADTVFYSINPAGSSYQLNSMSVFGQQNMQRFADETGGSAFLPKFLPIDTKDALQNDGNMRKNQDTLDRIFRQLANELRSQYLLQYYSDAEYPLNKFVKLDVGLQTRTDLRIRARQGFYVTN